MRRKKLTWYQWFLRSWLFMMLIWLFLGFALGTLVLFFPVRAWVNYVRTNELDDQVEKMGVVTMIILLAAVTFWISLKIYRWHLSKKKRAVTILSITIPFVLALGALSLFMNPNIVNSGAESSTLSQQFTIGPYPTAAKVKQLKAEGYTGIISLLHPAVVPFEPSLIDEEEEAAAASRIELVKAPMLPWIGDNTASLKKIEEIVRLHKGKYYIHCYLGKDRVNVVKNMITKLAGDESRINTEGGFTHRTLEQMKSFERGAIYKLEQDIYMTPYPTNEEFLSFFLAGKVRSVVNLMDSTDKDNKRWIIKERTELQKAGVVFRLYPFSEKQPRKVRNAVIDSILALPRPIVIHRWNTSSPDNWEFRHFFSGRTGESAVNLSTNVPENY